MSNAFLDTTQVHAAGGGSYHAAIDPIWNLRPLPQGGVVSAIALRAMEAELDHAPHSLRSLHTTFVAQVAHGPVEVQVDILRRGRSMSQLRAEVRNVGAERGHVTTAVFGAAREGFDFTDQRPPAGLAGPADCPSFRDPPPPDVEALEPMPFWTQVEGRPALGHAFWEDYTPDRAERAGWYRFDDPPMLDDATLDPAALVVLCDFMPGAIGEKVGGARAVGRPWFSPSVDLTVHMVGECRSEWVLAHNTARHAGDGYASADMSLWDCGDDGRGAPRLLAHGTQVCYFTFLD